MVSTRHISTTLSLAKGAALAALLTATALLLLFFAPSALAQVPIIAPTLDIQVHPPTPRAGERFRVTVETEDPAVRQISPIVGTGIQGLGHITSMNRSTGPRGMTSVSRYEFSYRQREPGPMQITGFLVQTSSGGITVDWQGPELSPGGGQAQPPPRSQGRATTPAQPPAAAGQSYATPRATTSHQPPAPGSKNLYLTELRSDQPDQPQLALASTHREAWLGESIIVDLLLYTPVNWGSWQLSEYDLPLFEGFWHRAIGQQRRSRYDGRVGLDSVNDQLYEIYHLESYQLQPLTAGEHTIQSADITIERRGFGQGGRLVQALSQPLTVQVREPPATGRPADAHILGAGIQQVAIRTNSRELGEGQWLEFHLDLEGYGLASRWVPPDLDGGGSWRIERANIESNQRRPDNAWLYGNSTITWRADPLRDGTNEIGAMKLASWNPHSERWDTWELEAIVVEVAAEAVELSDDDEPGVSASEELRRLLADSPQGAEPARGLRLSYASLLAALPWLLVIGMELRRLNAKAAVRRQAKPQHRRAKLKADLDKLTRERGVPWRAGFKLAEEALALELGMPVRGTPQSQLRQDIAELDPQSQARATQLMELMAKAEQLRFGGDTPDTLPQSWAEALGEALR